MEGPIQIGRINPLSATKHSLGVAKKKDKVKFDKTDGFSEEEIQRRKVEGECLHCAWPNDRKQTHRVTKSVIAIKLNKNTAGHPKARDHFTQNVLNPGASCNSSSIDEDSSIGN
jgi:hypothetical protein